MQNTENIFLISTYVLHSIVSVSDDSAILCLFFQISVPILPIGINFSQTGKLYFKNCSVCSGQIFDKDVLKNIFQKIREKIVSVH